VGITLASLHHWANEDSPQVTARPERPAVASEPEPEPTRYHLTDLGNAQRMVARHGANLRYCHPWKRWFVWGGARWAQDDTAQVRRWAKDTVRAIYAEASRLPDEDRRKAVAKHALRSESDQKLRAMAALTESEPGIPVLPNQLDRQPWRLNVLNGTLDLRTGELLPHERADLMTKLAPVGYDPDATCPLWLAFLDRVMDSNEMLIRFLQRAVGYSLTASTVEQCFLILYGTGANGKSTFLQTVSAMAGDGYARQTPIETLLVRQGRGIPNDIARLQGARLVTAQEAEEGQRLAESLVKQLTGGDRVAARFLHAEFFEFEPQFKIWLATNHKPAIKGTDYAIWRRIRLVPFTVTIPEAEQDKDLGTKLLAELDGILAWAVRGCLDWQRDGLGTPSEVIKATQVYRDESDVVGRFLEACCVQTENTRARAGALYKAYKAWCEESGERPISGTRFGLRLTERGLDKVKTTHVFYLGIGLLAEEEQTILDS